MNAPCKGCSNRTEDCHITCEAYNNFRAYRDDMLEKRHMEGIVLQTSRDGVKRVLNTRGMGKLRRK